MMQMAAQVQSRLFCPKCGWSNIRPSAQHGYLCAVLAVLWLAPLRCRNCRQRFYRFSRRKWNTFPPVEATIARPKRALSILEEPRPVPKPMAIAAPPSPPPPRDVDERRSILVVDSDLSVHRLLHPVLEREGYRIHELGHSTDLLRELRSAPVDLLITDPDMPQQA